MASLLIYLKQPSCLYISAYLWLAYLAVVNAEGMLQPIGTLNEETVTAPRGIVKTPGTSGVDETHVFISSGENVCLPCNNALHCTSTTWIYNRLRNSAAVELIAGGIKNKDTGTHERLSLGSDCSLNIKNVTKEDYGIYTCQQYVNEQQQGTDARVFLHVLHGNYVTPSSSSSSSQTEISPGSSVALFCQLYSYAGVSCDDWISSEGIQLFWVNQAGVKLTPSGSRYQISAPGHCISTLTTTLLNEDDNREWRCEVSQRNQVKTSATYSVKGSAQADSATAVIFVHITKSTTKTAVTSTQGNPTIQLVTVPSVGRSSSEPQKLECSGTGFNPKIKWLSESKEKTGSPLDRTVMDDGRVKVYSEILVPQEEWNKGVTYTCQIADGHNGQTSAKNTSICAVIAPSSQHGDVHVLGPFFSNLKSGTFVYLTCLVVGQNVKYFSIQWKYHRNITNPDIKSFMQNPLHHADGTQSIQTILKVPIEKWQTYAVFTCDVTHLCSNGMQKQNISKTRVNPQTPTLSLVPVTTQKSTFVKCAIEDFYPKDLTVQWKVNDTNSWRLEYKLKVEGLNKAYSFYKVSSETLNSNTYYSCEVTHQGKKFIVKKNFSAKFTLELKPPIEKEIFVNNRVVLEAVVSGDVRKTVEEASVSCKMKNELVNTSVTGTVNVSQDNSQFLRIDKITVDTEKWFDGEMVACTIHDTNNNRDIKQEIRFDKGDGLKPNVFIYTPDTINTDTVSLVCEVTSPKLGNVYIMWKVGEEPYIKGSTSAPIHQKNSTSVLNILTMSKQKYEDLKTTITCAVKHGNMDNTGSLLRVSTSQSKESIFSCY